MRARRDWLGPTALALCLAAIPWFSGEGAAGPADEEGRGVVYQPPPGRDAFFAANNYTSTTLLHLRGDGTFAEYDREHMFIAVSDEGRWRQTPSGGIDLCSHYRFEEIRQGGLTVYVGPNEAAGLTPLAATIEQRLSAIPGTGDLARRQLMPVVVRYWRSEDAFGPLPAGGLAPDIMSERERVSRKDLHSLAGAIRKYVGDRRGNLSAFVPRRYGDLVWLSHDDSPLGREIVRQYREHKEGPFLPGMVSVAVDAEAFASLLGTRQSFLHYPEMNVRIPRRALLADYRKARVPEPQCAGFEEGAVALPPLPTAAVTAVPAGEDLGFVTEGSETTLLLLGSDGRFSRYSRLENETKQTDAGEWSRDDDGFVRLCSHSAAFRPIEGDRLSLTVDGVIYSKLPRLQSALQRHLSANLAKASFDPKVIERLATRVLDGDRSGTEGCSCRRLVYGDEPVPRSELIEFVAELNRYLRSGTANLQEQRLFYLGSTTWLGDAAGRSNPAVIRTLQAFGDGPCILPDVFIRVPTPALLALRGPMPTNDAASRQDAAPLCAGFSREPVEGGQQNH
jgi:hypothetical protein